MFVLPICTNGTTRVVHSGPDHVSADVVIHLLNMKMFESKVLPAYRRYLSANDARPLIALLRECIRVQEVSPELSKRLLLNAESLKDDIGIIEGTVYYSPDEGKTSNQGSSKTAKMVRQQYATGELSGLIIEILCVPYDKAVDPRQDMTNSLLVNYLYDRSTWIKDVFTFSRTVTGRQLRFSIGESTEPFTRKGIEEFDRELSKVERPQDANMQHEFDNLRALGKRL
jgi:hypothetical protein